MVKNIKLLLRLPKRTDNIRLKIALRIPGIFNIKIIKIKKKI